VKKRKYFINLKILCLLAGEQKPTGTNSLGIERSLSSPEGPEGGAKKSITEGENAMRRKGMGLIDYQAMLPCVT
jgi:hypothetical protein